MITKSAAGLLMCRLCAGDLQYFLVHPGGPYFMNKDVGVWSIPKGIPEGTEQLAETAKREFFEETGILPQPPFFELGSIKQKGGKIVHAWAFAGSWNPERGIHCNTFILEWPPRSGKNVEFPEVDKAKWFDYVTAVRMIIPEQAPFLERAEAHKATMMI
jgi:predicted NUDIX family NTP pyrophosphohydrolase